MKNLLSRPVSDQTCRKPAVSDRLVFLLPGIILLLVLGSCNEPRERSAYSGIPGGYARVSVQMNSRAESRTATAANRLSNEIGVSLPNGSAMVIAVAAGTPFSIDYNGVTGYFDKQMVDLVSSTVTLTLPMNTAIQLFEYVFAEPHSLGSLGSANQRVLSWAVLGPFTLTAETTSIELEATLEYALDGFFSDLLTAGSYDIDFTEYEGSVYYSYESVDWQSLGGTSYVFNPVTRQFEAGTSPRIAYELINSDWVAASGHMPNATLDRVDVPNRTVYYTNPDFFAKLVAMLDLAVTGFDDKHESGGEEGSEGEEDSDSSGFMTGDDFTPGALAYVFEIGGSPDAEYRLESVAKSHDCTGTEFTTLADFISYHTTRDFTCKEGGYGPCLRFKQNSPGDSSGTLVETQQGTQTEGVGTWEITTVQTKQILLYYPDDTAYFYNGTYAAFWSVFNGKVWEGHRSIGDSTEPMYVPTFNAAAIADYRRFLELAPPEAFISETYDSCSYSQNWDEVTWDNFVWAP